MKKSTAGLALAAVVGFSALSATPAMAEIGAYPNCDAAAAVGVFNIPADAPGYGLKLDRDKNGIACEKVGVAYKPAPVAVVPPVVVEAPVEVAPVTAQIGAYPNCTAAAAAGVYNIPVGAPGYGVHLDSDKDGIGCEKAGTPYTGASVAVAPAVKAPVANVAPAAGARQIVKVPVGGADTGVATKSTDNTGVLALGGGLVLAAAAAGTFAVRRRNA